MKVRQKLRPLLERILDRAPVEVAVVRGQDHRLVYLNSSFQAIRPGIAMLGQPIAEVFPLIPTELIQLLDDTYRTGLPNRIREYETILAPGAAVSYWNAEYLPLPGAGERVEAVLIIAQDISEHVLTRKRLEIAVAEAQRSEMHFRVAQDLSLDGFVILQALRDESGAIADFTWDYANHAALAMMHLRAEDLRGRTLLQCLPGTRDNLFPRYVQVSETGRPHDIEIYYDSDGVRGWFRNMAVRLDDGVAVSFHDITERKQIEETLAAAVESKEMLLKEVNHRVKNNLQLVSSMLTMQRYKVADPRAQAEFEDATRRIDTLANMHKLMYQSDYTGHVDLRGSIQGLCAEIATSAQRADSVTIETDIAPLSADVDQAVPLFLLINELVFNAFKHAFPDGRSGQVRVTLRREEGCQEEGDRVLLEIADNGVGLPEDYKERKSLGLRLAEGLAVQLGGRLAIERGDWTKFSASFALSR